MDAKIKSTCIGFGFGWDKYNIECVSCQSDFVGEYTECMAGTLALAQKPKKQRVKLVGGGSLSGMCRKELELGKSSEEVKAMLINKYVEAGKDIKYAKLRACSLYNYVIKSIRKS